MSITENQPMDDNFHFEREKREFQEAKDRAERAGESSELGIEDVTGINSTVSGDDRSELKQEERTFQDKLGHKKYKAFTNQSSSENIPKTDNGPSTV